MPAVMMLLGCANGINRVSAKLTCQDYANAWARDAQSKGYVAGVLWYQSRITKPHAICWAEVGATTVYIEPQGCKWKADPYKEPGFKLLLKTHATGGFSERIDIP